MLNRSRQTRKRSLRRLPHFHSLLLLALSYGCPPGHCVPFVHSPFLFYFIFLFLKKRRVSLPCPSLDLFIQSNISHSPLLLARAIPSEVDLVSPSLPPSLIPSFLPPFRTFNPSTFWSICLQEPPWITPQNALLRKSPPSFQGKLSIQRYQIQ